MSRFRSFKQFATLVAIISATLPSTASSIDFSGRYMILDPRIANENSGGTLIVANGEIELVTVIAGTPDRSLRAKYRIADKAFLDGLRNEMKTNFRYSTDGWPLDCLVADGFGAVCKTDARPRTGRQFEIDLSTGYFFFTWGAVKGLKRL